MDFKTKPFNHQQKYYDDFKNKVFFANLCEQGTGKSWMELSHAAHLFYNNQINFVLILAPNEVHANWINEEIPKHLSLHENNIDSAIFRSTMKKADEKRVLEVITNNDKEVLKILAMNIESIIWKKASGVIDHILKNFNVLCIIDESTRIANPQAKVTKKILKLAPKFKARRIASGTPLDRKPLAAWSQFEFLSPSIFKMPYIAFRSKYAIMKEKVVKTSHGREVTMKFPVGYRNLDDLSEKVSRYSYRVLKKDCLDLPDKVYKAVDIIMGAKQAKAYKHMKDDLMYQFNNEIISAGSILEKLLHLTRITGGFASQQNPLPDNAKLKWLKDNIQGYAYPGKVIIWARFVDELKAIKELLGDEAVLVYGATNKNDRTAVFNQFREDDNIRFMVANPKVVGIGLTFLEATTQIYYSNSYELEVRRQSEDRSHRIGQNNKVLYIDLVTKDSIDETVLGNLKQKRELSDLVLKDPSCDWLK